MSNVKTTKTILGHVVQLAFCASLSWLYFLKFLSELLLNYWTYANECLSVWCLLATIWKFLLIRNFLFIVVSQLPQISSNAIFNQFLLTAQQVMAYFIHIRYINVYKQICQLDELGKNNELGWRSSFLVFVFMFYLYCTLISVHTFFLVRYTLTFAA